MSSISGSSAYHILILSGLAILLFAALARRNPSGTPAAVAASRRSAERWAIASGMLVGVQGLRLVTVAWASDSVLLPLLDRLFSVLLPALLGWAALGPEAGELPDRLLILVIVGSGGLFAVGAFLGEESLAGFNTSVLDQAWSLLALAVEGTALGLIVLRRPPQWAVYAGALTALLGGTLAHISTPPFTASSAPYVLLAEALAIPLFTVGAVWTFLREPVVRKPDPSSDAGHPAWRSLAAFVEVEHADSPTGYAASVTRAVGTLLGAEYCLLLTPPSADDALSIGAGYDSVHLTHVLNLQLEPGGCPVLSQAMARGRSVHLPGGTHSPDSRTVLRGLGLDGRSPALLVPLPADGRTVAGLLLLSPQAQHAWDDATRLALEQVAPSFGARLQALMAGPSVGAMSGPTSLELEQARRHIAELEARIGRRASTAPDLVGIDDLRRELDEAHATVEILQAEVDRLRAVRPPARPAADEKSDRLQAELALALQALAESRSERGGVEAATPSALPAGRDPRSAIHGVRQPLTAIAGYTELLLGESIGLLGTNQRRFLERIRDAVRRVDHELASLIEGLPGSGSEATPVANDLALLVEQALEVIHEDLRAKDLSVRLDLPSSPVRVPGNPASIRTIVSRLLANAADVTPTGREVLLSVLPAVQGLALLTVSDVGPGIAPADLPRVFSGDVWQDQVPGLGRDTSALKLVKTLTEQIGGRVWVESRPGGTSFSVLLPTVIAG
jgi:signal transduction histidine kinase